MLYTVFSRLKVITWFAVSIKLTTIIYWLDKKKKVAASGP